MTPSCLARITGKIELSLSEMETHTSMTSLEGKIGKSVLEMLILRFLLNIQVEMLNSKVCLFLNFRIVIWVSKYEFGRHRLDEIIKRGSRLKN